MCSGTGGPHRMLPPAPQTPPCAGMSPNLGVPSPANGLWGGPPVSTRPQGTPPSPGGVVMPQQTYALGPMSTCVPGTHPGMVMAAERGAAEAQVRARVRA